MLSLIFDLCPHSGSKVPDSRGIFYVGRWEVERRGGREMERMEGRRLEWRKMGGVGGGGIKRNS